MISLAVIFLLKVGERVFGEKNEEISRTIPAPSKPAQITLRG
jgi:hypothetical protein